MSFFTIVAVFVFLAPKTSPSPLVRCVVKTKPNLLPLKYLYRSAPEECPLNDGNLLNVRLFVKV